MAKSFNDWKSECVTASEELGLAVGDMWAEDDPYELAVVATAAFSAGQTPTSFVEETFAEDLARQAGDDDEFNQSLMEGED